MEDEKIRDLIITAEQTVNQSRYNGLSDLDAVVPDKSVLQIKPENVLCLFKISELVYGENEASQEKFPVVFNALNACGASCIMILECVEGRTELYIGAVNKEHCENINYLNVIRDILKTSIYGNLPGSEISEVISRSSIKNILNNVLDNGFDSQCITAVSCVPGMDDTSKQPAKGHGIEALLGTVRENNFSIIVMADPVSDEQTEIVKRDYEQLGTSLSSLENTSVTVQTGSNSATSETISTGINESLSHGIEPVFTSPAHVFATIFCRCLR